MMLPNMTPEAVTQLEQKGFRATPQLCQAASQNPAALRGTLTSVLGSPKEASEVMQVLIFNVLCNKSLNYDTKPRMQVAPRSPEVLCVGDAGKTTKH